MKKQGGTDTHTRGGDGYMHKEGMDACKRGESRNSDEWGGRTTHEGGRRNVQFLSQTDTWKGVHIEVVPA